MIEATPLERVVDLARAIGGMMTIGVWAALMVPSSGMVTWKSDSTSSR